MTFKQSYIGRLDDVQTDLKSLKRIGKIEIHFYDHFRTIPLPGLFRKDEIQFYSNEIKFYVTESEFYKFQDHFYKYEFKFYSILMKFTKLKFDFMVSNFNFT